MMPCDYISISGKSVQFDLEAVFDVCAGYSGTRKDWTATLVYVPDQNTFVELRSSPQDFRGNSDEEYVKVDSLYIEQTFSITTDQQRFIQQRPNDWSFINRRENA
jgi:hypothetical protein